MPSLLRALSSRRAPRLERAPAPLSTLPRLRNQARLQSRQHQEGSHSAEPMATPILSLSLPSPGPPECPLHGAAALLKRPCAPAREGAVSRRAGLGGSQASDAVHATLAIARSPAGSAISTPRTGVLGMLAPLDLGCSSLSLSSLSPTSSYKDPCV